VSLNYSLAIKSNDYVPYACAAIHDGISLEKRFGTTIYTKNMSVCIEEGPETRNLVKTHPIVILLVGILGLNMI
tara:strand:- start:3296 stop:3517 length:222 start_codon:yes stop_codon:yes gene_type:complete